MTLPFTVGSQGLAHMDEAARAFEYFRREGTPITQEQARRVVFAAYLVSQGRLSEYIGPAARPGRFVSTDPRKGWARR